jgi:thiol-disulfide isomerase/thioredoxin
MRRILLLSVLLAWTSVAHSSDTLDLASHEGKVILVDFWASWCVPCRRSFPWMNAMHDKYASDGLVIIAVNVDRDAANAVAFLDKYPARFEIVYDPEARLAKEYNIQVMPSSIIFGRDGAILDRHGGFKVKRQHEYETIIRTALGLESEE